MEPAADSRPLEAVKPRGKKKARIVVTPKSEIEAKAGPTDDSLVRATAMAAATAADRSKKYRSTGDVAAKRERDRLRKQATRAAARDKRDE